MVNAALVSVSGKKFVEELPSSRTMKMFLVITVRVEKPKVHE